MNDADFGLKIKQLMALDFVPVPHVVDKFDKLMSQQFFVINEELLIHLLIVLKILGLGDQLEEIFGDLQYLI
jgi:hypothetical protein